MTQPLWQINRHAYIEREMIPARKSGREYSVLIFAEYFHAKAVSEAVAAGLPVPENVLIDYPGLRREAVQP